LAPLASICDLLQAFFHKFRTYMHGVRGGKESHCQIVEALHDQELDKAIGLLRHHMSGYEGLVGTAEQNAPEAKPGESPK
jgi:DNA-binding GntR family transcriptional regulator